MTIISRNIVFYITIVEKNKTDHSFLRSMIHRVLPQAIVESVYEEEEAIHYFNNCSVLPHLIFLDEDMLLLSGRDTLELIRRVEGLDKVPLIFLTGSHTLQTSETTSGGSHFYSKPYQAQELRNIVSSLSSRWVA